MKRNSINLIVPVYNEEKNINEFIKEVKPILNDLTKDWQIIFINDGSKDKTLDKIKEEKDKLIPSEKNKIKIINFSRNFGKENALTAGLKEVTKDCAIPIDVDLQDPPELIKEMYNIWQKEKEVDVVYAKRTIREGETFFKLLSANLFYKLMNKLSDFEIPENVGDFRLIDKKVVNELNKLNENNRFMKGLFAFVGYNQKPIEFIRNKRFAGDSNFNFFKLLNLAVDGITSFSSFPLRLISYMGILISIFSFTFGIFVITRTIIDGIDIPGYASTLTVILFLGGIQLIAIGILGEYIGKIYTEVKNRPNYFIKEII
jgi:glycosyltransferase involved in cell wall biosynthesis